MRIKEIKNLDGEVIFTYDEDDTEFVSGGGGYDFSGANLEKADIEMEVWQDVNLRKANLKKAEIYSGLLAMSDLSEADCEETKFLGTGLQQVNFTKANLTNAVFGRCNLGGTTNVCGANFTDAILDGAKFDKTRYDAKTIFPKKFNPSKHELVCIEDE